MCFSTAVSSLRLKDAGLRPLPKGFFGLIALLLPCASYEDVGKLVD